MNHTNAMCCENSADTAHRIAKKEREMTCTQMIGANFVKDVSPHGQSTLTSNCHLWRASLWKEQLGACRRICFSLLIWTSILMGHLTRIQKLDLKSHRVPPSTVTLYSLSKEIIAIVGIKNALPTLLCLLSILTSDTAYCQHCTLLTI